MSTKISQREARRLQKRVQELECVLDDQRARWSESFPGGVNIATVNPDTESFTAVKTARRLGHAVVVVNTESGKLDYYGIRLEAR